MTDKTMNVITSFSEVFLLAEEVTFDYGEVVIQQYAKAEHFYLLSDGQVSFYLNLDGIGQELEVGKSNEPLTPIGWSSFRPPHRYSITVRASSPRTKAYRWKLNVLSIWLEERAQSTEFLKMICVEARNIIKSTILLLSKYSVNLIQQENTSGNEKFQTTALPGEDEVVHFLRHSPFFEVFEEQALVYIARHIERRQYQAGDFIFKQGKTSPGIFLLVSGKITFSYEEKKAGDLHFRNIDTPGFMIGWSGSLDIANLINAFARQESIVYFISKERITSLIGADRLFTNAYYHRLLWLIGHQLQAVRSRFISVKFNREVIAIRNLIEHNSTRLNLNSNLHKVPHLLENKLTLREGLQMLRLIKANGSTLEKNLSALCLDLVTELQKEHKFYMRLVKVYQSVVNANPQLPPFQIRKICAEKFNEAWEGVPTLIRGLEHLPATPGHIFIYNHLRNHPYNTLPNNFQVTLDSHFISSVILHKRYGDPGVRIVRIGRGAEYAHQDYYQRLGHIDVYTSESDITKDTYEYQEKKRQAFYAEAGAYLQRGFNLIISPEGTSYPTESSPGPFKSGAFRLALNVYPEPYIVPIAIANFDKRIRNNVFSCIVQKPFKASERVKDKNNKDEMKAFIESYQSQFKAMVEEAVYLAENPLTPNTNDGP